MQMNSSENEGMNDINVTPLVDVMLVLLIIFMISTPAMVYQGLKISLPQIAHAEEISHVTLHLTLTKEGDLLLDAKPTSFDAIKGAIAKLKQTQTQGDAIIAADKSIIHGKVMELADFLKAQGISQVAFTVSSDSIKAQPKSKGTKKG